MPAFPKGASGVPRSFPASRRSQASGVFQQPQTCAIEAADVQVNLAGGPAFAISRAVANTLREKSSDSLNPS